MGLEQLVLNTEDRVLLCPVHTISLVFLYQLFVNHSGLLSRELHDVYSSRAWFWSKVTRLLLHGASSGTGLAGPSSGKGAWEDVGWFEFLSARLVAFD